MSVIVGLIDGRTVWMGADSFTGNSNYALLTKHPKIVRRAIPNGGEMLIGISGGHRPHNLLSNISLPERPQNMGTMDYLIDPFINAVRERFKQAGYQKRVNEREGDTDAHLLIGYDGCLFSVWDDFDIVETRHSYMAIGSGMNMALAALHVTQDALDPEDRLLRVMQAVASLYPYALPPFHVVSVTKKQFSPI